MWTRHGVCNGCGFCCQTVAREAIVRTDAQIAHDPQFYAARGFQTVFLGGEYRHFLFAWLQAPCPSHEPGVGCKIYDSRPKTCQTFPQLPVNIVGTPCSYWFEDESGYTIGGHGSLHPATYEDLLDYELTHGTDAAAQRHVRAGQDHRLAEGDVPPHARPGRGDRDA